MIGFWDMKDLKGLKVMKKRFLFVAVLFGGLAPMRFFSFF